MLDQALFLVLRTNEDLQMRKGRVFTSTMQMMKKGSEVNRENQREKETRIDSDRVSVK